VGDLQFEGRERVRYTKEELLKIRETVEETPGDILKLRHDIDAELFGEDQSWGRVENNLTVEVD
ncbi:eukaryotic initiation factor iso-4F subunit p82-34, partial [Trifolium medium]|nr:eukaryotic initiation factor iso-4F subunit p82-34 [Trifolium medium]